MSVSITWKIEKVCWQGKAFGALLTDLSDTFDCHDLLIVQLNAYGLSLPALRLIYDFC